MKRIIDGERPSRPPRGKELGLSDELWETIRSSLAHEAGERPSASALIDFLEKVIPDITVLKELAEFDANSEEHIQSLRQMFEYGDNTFLGMREDETLVVIEVFDQVASPITTSLRTSKVPDYIRLQVLNSSSEDSKLRGQCLHGLQRVSARCGLLPKSYWISHSGLTGLSIAPSVTGRVSSIRRWSMGGSLVAVKSISPNCIDNLSAFKHVRFSSFSKHLRSTLFSVRVLTEAVR